MRPFIALAPLALLMSAPALAQSDAWVVNYDASSVGLQTEVFGTTIRGDFPQFSADIRLDPDDLSDARIEAIVQADSGQLDAAERQSDMVGEAGLNPSEHPEMRFVSESITREGDTYTALGTLTIKGVTQEQALIFTLDITGDRGVADGGFTLARSDFGVGARDWGAAAAQIEVRVHIEAVRED